MTQAITDTLGVFQYFESLLIALFAVGLVLAVVEFFVDSLRRIGD